METLATNSIGMGSVVTADALGVVLTELKSVLPVVVQAVLGIVAFRKVVAFVKSQIKSA